MAKVALGGSFRTIRSYGTENIGAYLRSLRIAKQEAEDNYWTVALQDGSEKPADVLAYWEGQKGRFEAGTIDYKTYQAKIKNIEGIVDISEVNNLIAEKDYDGAISYYESTIMPKYDEESPAWSENFVNLQKIKEAKISNDISLQDAKTRAKYSVGGLTGRNLSNYYAEMIRYLEDQGLSDREEYFSYIAKHGDAVEAVSADEATKETAQYNKRVNELIGQKEGVITARDWVNIYSQLAGEFPKGGEGYANALENLTKAQTNLQASEEKTRINEFNIIKNEVLNKYAAGGISDPEYASALQEMLTLVKPGSEEYNTVARELGNLQETLAGKGKAEAEEATVKRLMESITTLEAQEKYQKTQFLSGLITGSEYDEWRKEFLEKATPFYSGLGKYSNDSGLWQKIADYQGELQRVPEKAEQRKRGELLDIVETDPKTGEMNINTVNLKGLAPEAIPAEGFAVVTDKGVQTITYDIKRGTWKISGGKEEFAKPPVTKEISGMYQLPAGLGGAEVTKRIQTLREVEEKGEQVNPQDILNPGGGQAKPFSFAPLVTKATELARTPYEALYGGAPKLPEFKLPEIKLPEFKMPEFKMPEFNLPSFNLPKFELPKFEMPKFTLPTFDFGKTISGITQKAKDIWGGFKAATSKWSPFW